MMDSGLIIRDESRMRWTCLQGLLKDGRYHVEVINIDCRHLVGINLCWRIFECWWDESFLIQFKCILPCSRLILLNYHKWLRSFWMMYEEYKSFGWINWIFWFSSIIYFIWKIKQLSDASENIRINRRSVRKITWARMDMHENYVLQFTLEGYNYGGCMVERNGVELEKIDSPFHCVKYLVTNGFVIAVWGWITAPRRWRTLWHKWKI